MTDTPKITAELIERVARRMCEAMKMNPDECRTIGDGYYPLWEKYEHSALEAIAARIALDEVMGPDRATLLAEAAEETAAIKERMSERRTEHGVISVPASDWRSFAAALRAKAGGGGGG